MTNYTKITNFAAKDTLTPGDANKKVKGTEIDNEFNAIVDAIDTKADSASPALTGTPTAPTAAAGTATTQIATTAFVNAIPIGKVLQVVYGNAASDQTTTNSTSYVDSATASITPSSSSSKILVLCNQYSVVSDNGANQGQTSFYIDRDGTNIYTPGLIKIQDTYVNFGMQVIFPAHYLDSPATTTSVTYTIKARNDLSSGGTFISKSASSITLLEIGA